MTIVKYQGKDVEAEEIDVVMETERWNEYQLVNGSILSVKSVLIKVFKAVDTKTSGGEALYLINTQNIVKVK